MFFKSRTMENFLQNSFNHDKNSNYSLTKENDKLKENLENKKEYVDDLKDKLSVDEEGFVFSIVVAVYNTEEYLKESIESVINQSFPFSNVQLILVDDGSTDGSANICKEYVEKYPENVIYIYQENQGQSSARNNGLKIAEGKYLNFLDSDDKLEVNTLYDVYNFFKDNEEKIDVVSIPRYQFGRANGLLVFSNKFNETRIVDINEEYDFPQTAINSAFIKRNAFDFEFDKRIIISEDSILINKIILKKCKVGIVSTSRYMYRKRESENSTIDTKKTKKEYFNPRMKYYFKNLIDYTLKKHGYVLKYIQYVLMYDLRWLFLQNTECGVLNKEETEEFYSHIHDVLQYVDDDVILSQNLSKFLKYHILNFKHNPANFKYDVKGNLYLMYNDEKFDSLSDNEIILNNLVKKDNAITLSGSFEFYSDVLINSFNNDQKLNMKLKKIDKEYAIGRTYSNKYYFDLNVDLNEELNNIHFEIILDSQSYLLSINYDKIDVNKFRSIKFNDKNIMAKGKKTYPVDIYEKYRILELNEEISNLERNNNSLKQKNISLINKNNHFKFSKFYKAWEKHGEVENFDKKDNKPKNLRDIKVALIADQFTYDSYKYEFTVIDIHPDNWKQKFIQEKPDLFFCESAWDGYNFEGDYGPWHEKIFKDFRVDYENRTELLAILDYCNENSIPTIFWNKEDPTSYKNKIRSFADTASKFDYIFTSAKECVSQYKSDFNHKHVYPLMFAGQPKLFNPLKFSTNHIDGVVFAGSYYDDFPQRAKMMDDIFDRLIEKNVDLVIYDRYFYYEVRNYPKRYEKYINPPINYNQTANLYKECDWCINFNTITKSETMFARRIFELALSFTNILTNYSKGIDKIFKDNVFVFDKSELLPDFSQNYDNKRLNNLYNVLENHTYKKRWMEILDKIGFEYVDDVDDVSVIYKLNDEDEIDKIVANFNNIDYHEKDLRILVTSNEVNIKELREKCPEAAGIYEKSEINILKNEINSEYWILTDSLIDSNFIKKAILHYQYLNKRIGIGYGEDIFKITQEKSVENKLFNRTNLNYLTHHNEIDIYSIGKQNSPEAKISVVIPVYNSEDYLVECLDSIVNQTFKDIEIICIDDGSTDGSLEILKEYEKNDSRITVYTQENQGPSRTRNRGMDLAKGEYLYFMDSDDFIELNSFKELYKISQKTDADIILFKMINYVEETKERYTTTYYDMPYLADNVGGKVFTYKDDLYHLLFIPVTSPGKFFKREFISKIRFPEDIKFEDNIFIVESLIKARRMYFYDEYLYHRRIRPNSITTTFYDSYKDFIKMNNMLFEKVEELGVMHLLKRSLYNKKIHNTHQQFTFLEEAHKKEVFEAFKEDFLNHKEEYESDDVFLNEIDERSRQIFYSCIESDNWQEFELKVSLFEKQSELDSLKSINRDNKKVISQLNQSNSKQKREIDELERENNELLSSSSWKVTKPLRKLKRTFKEN